jgi:hypothetical protein
MVQARTRIMNQLQAVALNEGLRCKKRLWREARREQLESFRLAPWASRRRRDLLELLQSSSVHRRARPGLHDESLRARVQEDRLRAGGGGDSHVPRGHQTEGSGLHTLWSPPLVRFSPTLAARRGAEGLRDEASNYLSVVATCACPSSRLARGLLKSKPNKRGFSPITAAETM